MLTILVLLAISAPAAGSARVAAQPLPSASAIHVDGDLSEDVWQQAPVITGFRQREPNDGAAASFETEARVAYDGTAMYIAVQAVDPDPSRIVGIRTRRDGDSPLDWIRVMVDSFHDRRSAYEFSVNPAGVKSDAYWFNDGNSDRGWDAVWDVAVSRNERGWRAEFRVPFSQLRFHPSPDAIFGFAVVRQIGRLNETTTWPLLSKSANGYVSSFGELTGLRLGSSQKRLEYDPMRSSLNGTSAALSFNKIAGEHVRFSTNVSMKTPGFDSNDVGFLRRADSRNMSNWVQWRNERPSKYLRSFRFNLNQWAGWNFDGDRLNLGYNVNAHAVFKNNWATGSGANLNPQPFDDRATRGGPGAYGNAGKSLWGYLDTDSRKPLQGGVNFFVARDTLGSGSSDVSPSITWRPSSFLSVNTGLSVSRSDDQQQWIANEDTRHVFGRLQQRTVAVTARVNYTVTPTLSIQLYAQPFVSAGDYSRFKQLADGRARNFAQRFSGIDYDGNPDFNYRSFRTTNVLRWEHRPGSTLFVVWQQGREDTLDHGTFRFGRDFGGVFDAPARNVFLVKWAYWLNY